MHKRSQLRRRLFEIYSQNLQWVKEHPSIRFEPDFDHGYICPICFEVFFESDLLPNSKNQLTIEDIPPISLGGKPRALTCKQCNSKSGHILDNQLLKRLEEIDFHELLPNSKTRTKYELNGNKINGSVEIDEKGKWIFKMEPQNSNPKEAQIFQKELFPPKTFKNPLFYGFDAYTENQIKSEVFSISKPNFSDERRANIALLRIAYLYAFSFFGHGFLINPGLIRVREQILNPDKNILGPVFWIKYDFPESMIGMNIISRPETLKCFLVIFKLRTKSKVRQFAIALPGLSSPGLDIYKNIESILCQEKEGAENILLTHIEDLGFLKQKDLAHASNSLWHNPINN